jgi:multidrug efflux pump subunit AcrA (membrane-fusion protein)
MNAVFHLVDARTLKLSGTIAERELGVVKPGDPVIVKVGDREVQGKLVAVVGATDPMTRRVPIEALLENAKDSPILPGQYVRASIRGGAEVSVLSLPATALRPGSQDEIFVVRDGKLHLRHVVFAVGEGGKLLVREGLDAKDDVATNPAADWHEGDAVTPGVEGSR